MLCPPRGFVVLRGARQSSRSVREVSHTGSSPTTEGAFFMSNYVLTWVWKNAPVTDPTCLLVLASLADQANDDGYCWPSVASTAKRCRISERQVQRWIGSLVEQGLLEVRERPGTSNMYRIMGGDVGVTPDMGVTGGVTSVSGEGRHGRHPNHKEPSKNPQKVLCPYCRDRFTFGKPHDCSAMNMRMR